MWWLIFVVVLLFLALSSGGWGYSRYGYWGLTPATVILAVVAVLYFTGHLNWN